MVVVVWVLVPCSFVGGWQRFWEHAVSIFRAEVTTLEKGGTGPLPQPSSFLAYIIPPLSYIVISALKMETVWFSEKLAFGYKTTLLQTPK
jgi:hypothetical protein